MEKIKYIVMEYPIWNKYTTKRYHKFINKFVETEYDLMKTARHFSYKPNDMKSILGRIENELQQMKRQVDEGQKYTLYDIEEVEKRNRVRDILCQSGEVEDFQNIYPEKLTKIIQVLRKEKSIERASERLGIPKRYILERLLGRKKPRKPCERGAEYYLNKNKKAIS